ncbi:phosphonate ABC transporter, permease protein PhnE [Halobacteriales archaeon SW_7_68_16]|nr:MAG: phosphonate ABC transporter, permease protein PhnE [Halobacteriales archaeon SW_7_68_16]
MRAAVEPATDGDDSVEDRLAELKRAKTIRRVVSVLAVVTFAVVFYWSLLLVGFSIAELLQYRQQFLSALSDFFPTTTATVAGVQLPVLDAGAYWAFLAAQTNPTIPRAALTTLAIGFAGTVLGAPGALAFGVLGSERVTPFPLNFLFRGVMSTIRAIPALVWALIFIPLGGLSPFTATLAIGTDTVGNLGRLFTDELEEVADGPIEAIESTGGSRPQVVTFGMLSQVFRPFIAWTMYILEINVRIAVTMGLIGAGGIGQILRIERGQFHYTNMMATILVIFVLVVSVEMVSQRTRSYLRPEEADESLPTLLWRLVTGLPERMADAARR